MKKIKLTNGKIVKIDDKYFTEFNRYSWYYEFPKKGRLTGYAYRKKLDSEEWNSIHIKMHRYIMHLEGNPIFNKKIDHKDGDGLNNQIKNLRISNSKQNKYNSKKYINNKSGYKGVSLHKEGKWVAQINVNSKKIYLGLYKNTIDAAKAYNNAAIKYHGEFANLNKIENG